MKPDNPLSLMTDEERLESSGWRKIGQRRNRYGFTKYWDHPDYTPVRRGAFTQGQALAIQIRADKKAWQLSWGQD